MWRVDNDDEKNRVDGICRNNCNAKTHVNYQYMKHAAEDTG